MESSQSRDQTRVPCIGRRSLTYCTTREVQSTSSGFRYMRAKSLQSCLTPCDPIDCSLPGSSVHGIFQSRILERVAMPSSRGSSQPRDWTPVSCGSCIAGSFFTTEPLGKPMCLMLCIIFPYYFSAGYRIHTDMLHFTSDIDYWYLLPLLVSVLLEVIHFIGCFLKN